MKRCLACGTRFEERSWECPHCGFTPPIVDDIRHFAESSAAMNDDGFKPEFFARLASLEGDNFWFRARNRLIQWAIQTYFPNVENLFEIGCGTGFVLAGLHQTRPELRLVGSELFSEGLVFTKLRLPEVELFQMDARHIPFENEFDVVGAFDVLEHIAEDEQVLSEMFRATRPGGGILLTVPQHPFLWSKSDEHALHQRRYRRKELERKVKLAGFQPRRITSFVSLLLPLMILARRSKECDPWAEFQISRPLNFVLEKLLAVERGLIRTGLSFPVGGSLLVAADKPLSLS